MSDNTKGSLCLLTASVIWGSGFIAQKLGMSYLEPFTFNGIRLFIAGCILLVLTKYLTRNEKRYPDTPSEAEVFKRHKKDLIKASLLIGFVLFLATNLQQIGLVTVTASKAGFIAVLYVIFVPIIGLLFHNKVEKKIWLCVILAVAGFALLSLKGGISTVSKGDLVTLLCAVFYAIQIILVDHFITRTNPVVLSTMEMLVASILSFICMFVFENPNIVKILSCAPIILYSAIVPTALGYTLQIIGQKNTDPTITSLLMSLEAVFSAIFGALFLKEHLSPLEITGCTIIFSAIIIAQLPKKEAIYAYKK